MPVTDLIQAGTPKPKSITCPSYTSEPEGKRCVNYLDGGGCSLPDELMCIEWLKLQPSQLQSSKPHPSQSQTKAERSPQAETSHGGARRGSNPVASQSPPRDLFGNLLPPPKPPKKPVKARKSPAESMMPWKRAEEAHPLENAPGLRTEDVQSFKRLQAQVCIETRNCGSIWIVPEYSTAQDSARKELTPEHAAFLSHVTRTFPEAHIVSFERLESNAPSCEETPHLKDPQKEVV